MTDSSLLGQVFHPECTDFIAAALRDQTPPTARLQRAIEERYNRHAVLVNGHAASLHLALCALDFKRGDRVLCSVNNFPLAAQAVRYFDAEPIFIDCNDTDYNIDLDALKRQLERNNHKKLRALFLSHHSGNCADVGAISAICEPYGVRVINDCSGALEMRLGNELLGATQEISCYSFSPACAEPLFTGGFLLFKDQQLAERARLLGNNALVQSKRCELDFFYEISDLGHDYAMGELSAAAALYMLQNAPAAAARRAQIASAYDAGLANLRHVCTPQRSPGSAHSAYIIRVSKNRDSFARELAAMGVDASIHYIPINFLAYYKQKYSLKITDFPGALRVYPQILSLPLHSGLSDETVSKIIEAVCELDARWV